MSRYHEIAEALRARIQNGEFPVGSQLPGISALQDEYDVRGLQTIRSAQQLLVEEGMLETRQGVGAFVTSTTPVERVDVLDTITKARDSLNTAIAAIGVSRRSVTFDFEEEDEEAHFVLTEALREWAWRQRGDAEIEDEESTRDKRLKWMSVAESLAERVEAAA